MAIEFELSRVAVRFGSTVALRDVELKLAAGESAAFVGPSGAGKTTLLRLMNGSLRPDDGVVRAGGAALGSLSRYELRQLRARVGFIHQGESLVPNLRVSQNVMAGRLGRWSLPGALRRIALPRRPELAEVLELLDRVGIGEKIFERTSRLSGGQQQRVAIARALYQKPDALLADEPVSSVDPARARDTVALLTELSRERALTLCMSLHNLDLARAFFPRLIGVRSGRIVFDRPSTDVGEREFEALYQLSSSELWVNGA